MEYVRGSVVKGPDFLAGYEYRPYVRISDKTHPFHDEEALYTAVTTTKRAVAIPLMGGDFVSGGLPRKSSVNPWTITSIRHADIRDEEGRLSEEATNRIAREAAGYLGVK